MKNNFLFPFMLMIGMLFSGFSSFSQSVTSLNPQQKKDAAYVQAHQQQINQGIKPAVKAKTPGTSVVSATPKKDQSAVINAEPAKSPNYYNARSIIYTDPRTPRYPITGNREQDVANYNNAKAVWMANNPQPKTTTATTPEQREERSGQNK